MYQRDIELEEKRNEGTQHASCRHWGKGVRLYMVRALIDWALLKVPFGNQGELSYIQVLVSVVRKYELLENMRIRRVCGLLGYPRGYLYI